MLSIFRNIAAKIAPSASVLSSSQLHTSAISYANEPRKFIRYNNKIYEPQSPEEEPRKAVNNQCE